jgi:hypothetical protein
MVAAPAVQKQHARRAGHGARAEIVVNSATVDRRLQIFTAFPKNNL